MGTYPDNSISVSCCRCHQIADLPDSFPSSHAIFFNCLVIIDNFLCHFFKSFLFVFKKSLSISVFQETKRLLFPWYHSFSSKYNASPAYLLCCPPCIPDALIPSITGSPASAYFTFGKRTPRSVQNICLLSHTCRQVSESTAQSLLFLFNIFAIFLLII